jgi:hypothetical protein
MKLCCRAKITLSLAPRFSHLTVVLEKLLRAPPHSKPAHQTRNLMLQYLCSVYQVQHLLDDLHG